MINYNTLIIYLCIKLGKSVLVKGVPAILGIVTMLWKSHFHVTRCWRILIMLLLHIADTILTK